MDARILIVDDDAQQRRFLSDVLIAAKYEVMTAEGGREALKSARADGAARPNVMLLDLNMSDMDGIETLTELRKFDTLMPVLVLTSDGSLTRAVSAMRAGANDFLIKPIAPERLDVSIRNALAISDLSTEVRRLSKQEENRLSFDDLVSVSSSTRGAITLAKRAARSDIPVLIEGESGTGKEIFARAIHGSSERSGAPFVAVNCGALPAQLVESILFGHEKGAFTGAVSRRIGRFQEANGGTLFLDEVGELPLDAQVKLLRAIQTGEVDPVGATGPTSVDIRLVSATNRDLRQMVEAGSFREDLYYRLSVFPLKLPPLRDRREDIPGLARLFLKRFTAAEAVAVDGFTLAALEMIAHADWPGNVRQLENTIHRAVVMADGPLIAPSDLHGIDPPERMRNGTASGEFGRTADALIDDGDQRDPLLRDDGHIRRLMDIEAEAIARALTIYRGRMSETARRLGIGRSTLYRKIDELQIDKRDR